MQITKEYLLQRKNDFIQQRNIAFAQMHGADGAIAICDHLLSVINIEEEKLPEVGANMPITPRTTSSPTGWANASEAVANVVPIKTPEEILAEDDEADLEKDAYPA